MQGLFPFFIEKESIMLDLVIFIVSFIFGILISIMIMSNKNVIEALDCVKSIFETGHWSSR